MNVPCFSYLNLTHFLFSKNLEHCVLIILHHDTQMSSTYTIRSDFFLINANLYQLRATKESPFFLSQIHSIKTR